MNYQRIADPLLDLLEADADLTAIVGTAIYMAGERDFEVPSVEWMVISDVPNENMADVLMQVDLFSYDADQLATMESVIQRHWDSRTELVSSGVYTQSSYESGGPVPGADEGVHARTLTFRHTTVRERYV